MRGPVQSKRWFSVGWLPRKVCGACGILAPLLALLFIWAAIAIHPWFNFPGHALSALGALKAQQHWVYNLGMILVGSVGIVFASGVPSLANSLLGIGGVGVFVAGFLNLVLVGIFPGGTGPHNTVSMLFFLLSTIGILLLGIDQLLDRKTRPWGVLLISLIALGLTSVLLVGTIEHLGAAIPETIAAFAFSEFSIVFGLRLLGLL